MGKANRKMNKKKQKEQQKQAHKNWDSLKAKMFAFEEAFNYAEAINTLSELIEAGCREEEIMVHGAKDYYQLGDYERAGKWVDVTLNFAPNNLEVRILLAHLCLLNDRIDDALSVLEFVLKNGGQNLPLEQQEDMEDMLAYYGKHEAEMLKEEYPLCWQFIAKEGQNTQTAAEQKAVEAEPSVSDDTMEEEAENTEETVEEHTDDDIVGIIAEIEQKEISLQEKVRLLNSFAASYYYQKELGAAARLLDAALRIDACHNNTLRNMAMVQNELGSKEKALELAGKMFEADFVLLKQLR